MGRCPSNKNRGKHAKGHSHKSAKLQAFLSKGPDVIYDELRKKESTGLDAKKAKDEDLPGMGQFYCLHCDRYFKNDAVRAEHNKTKLHRKKVKLMSGGAPHSQLDAEMAAGMGKPDNGPRLRSSTVAVAMNF